MSDIQFAEQSQGKDYVIDTTTLKRLNRYAVKADLNRSLSDEGVALLDNAGFHIITCLLPLHTNAEGKVSIRAKVLAKLKGKVHPEVVFLDVAHKDWRKCVEESARPLDSI